MGDDCVCGLCGMSATLWVRRNDGTPDVLYTAQPHQLPYHLSATPNVIMVGPRGTGKSLCMRMDAHMRALSVTGYRYLIIRRQFRELKLSHLQFIKEEMVRLGGDFNLGDSIAYYPNGSLGYFGYCDTPADMHRYLSAEYDLVVGDEVATFSEEILLKMLSCVRVPKDSGRIGMFRGGSNKLGPGAEFMRRYFYEKSISLEENEEYRPEDYEAIDHKWGDNKRIDLDQYRRRLSALGEQTRKAWLDNEWVIEGAYFNDFRPVKNGQEWHVVEDMPTAKYEGNTIPLMKLPFVRFYRAIDWGYDPDPAVCLWFAVLPNRRVLVFREKSWRKTNAADVARQIKQMSEGMRIVETFSDPTMLLNDGKGQYCLGEIFEQNGVPLTPSMNKRDYYGVAIHQYLNTEIDGLPQLQILADNGYEGCKQLIRTLPLQQVDPKDPNMLADGNDHWVVTLAYFCMGGATPLAAAATKRELPRWMVPKSLRPRMMV